jgi:hypothetical protein
MEILFAKRYSWRQILRTFRESDFFWLIFVNVDSLATITSPSDQAARFTAS